MVESRRWGWMLVIGLGACAEVEPPPCEIEVEAVIEVPRRVCAVTPTGLVVRINGAQIVLETLDSSEGWGLVELARIEDASFWCPAVAQDPSTGTIWLARGPTEFEAPAELLRFTADGTWVASEALVHEGEPVAVSSLLARDGALTIAGSVHLDDAPDWHEEQAFLQRRDALGQPQWTQVGFAGLSPNLSEAGLAFHRVGSLVPLRSRTAMLATISYLDTSSYTLLTVDDESGEVVGVEPAKGGGGFTMFPRLGSDGEDRLSVATTRDSRYVVSDDLGHVERIQPARSVVATTSGLGWILWWTEHELPGWHDPRSTEPVANRMSVFNVVSGTASPNTEHLSVVRHDWTGAVDCSVSLDATAGLRDGESLTRVGERTLVLSASVATGVVDDWDRAELRAVLVILDAPVEWPAWASPG